MKKQMWITLLLALAVVAASACCALADQSMAKSDQKFLMEAADGGMMEVQFGQLAQKNAQAPEVKQFAERMVTDHGKGGEELKALAQQKNLSIPGQMQQKHMKDYDKLSKISGANFDRMYMNMMVKDHIKDVADFRKATQKVKDPYLNAWAAKTLPVLEQHLQQAKEVSQKLGIISKTK
jgi:putative membrane protein